MLLCLSRGRKVQSLNRNLGDRVGDDTQPKQKNFKIQYKTLFCQQTQGCQYISLIKNSSTSLANFFYNESYRINKCINLT